MRSSGCSRSTCSGPCTSPSCCCPACAQRGYGRVVMVGSMLASFPLAYRSSYVASKAALKGFATAARYEMAPYGVWLTTVEPGSINTGISQRRTKYIADDSPHARPFQQMLQDPRRQRARGHRARSRRAHDPRGDRGRRAGTRCTPWAATPRRSSPCAAHSPARSSRASSRGSTGLAGMRRRHQRTGVPTACMAGHGLHLAAAVRRPRRSSARSPGTACRPAGRLAGRRAGRRRDRARRRLRWGELLPARRRRRSSGPRRRRRPRRGADRARRGGAPRLAGSSDRATFLRRRRRWRPALAASTRIVAIGASQVWGADVDEGQPLDYGAALAAHPRPGAARRPGGVRRGHLVPLPHPGGRPLRCPAGDDEFVSLAELVDLAVEHGFAAGRASRRRRSTSGTSSSPASPPRYATWLAEPRGRPPRRRRGPRARRAGSATATCAATAASSGWPTCS